ncbi:hypothetical protein HY086_03805 [Candidatus Gottesmanbacteria bacterium]|nr:hypothetical protein [Candidatus Gottesmanbacteria bacterium]
MISRNEKNLGVHLFVGALAIVAAATNSLHVLVGWWHNPPSHVFTGIAHSVADYFLYTDVMAQGAAGHLVAVAHFTNEILPPLSFYWFNTMVGWLGGLVGLSPFATYNVAVVVLVFLLCLLWYKLCRLLFPANRLAQCTAFLFILTASSFIDPKGFIQNGRLDLLFPFWFSPAPAFNRLGAVPHQIFQTILLILLVIEFCRKQKNFLALSLLTFLAALANPIQLILVLAAAVVTAIWQRRMLPLVMLFAVAIPSLILSKEWLAHPIIAVANAWEALQYQRIPPDQLIVAIGPIAILALFGIIPFIRAATSLRVMYLSYGVLSFVAFYSPLSSMTGTAIARFLHPAPYGILGLLGAEGILAISHWLATLITQSQITKHQTPSIKQVLNSKVLNLKRFGFGIWNLGFVWNLEFGIWNLLMILYLLFTLPALYSQINARANPALHTFFSETLRSNLNHVPKPVVDALSWIKQQPDGGRPVVLTDPALPYDILVPVFTGKISFTGHPIHTLYPQVKENLRSDFFTSRMSPDRAKQFLTDHRIRFIVTKPTSVYLPYLFLKKSFENDAIAIFVYD